MSNKIVLNELFENIKCNKLKRNLLFGAEMDAFKYVENIESNPPYPKYSDEVSKRLEKKKFISELKKLRSKVNSFTSDPKCREKLIKAIDNTLLRNK